MATSQQAYGEFLAQVRAGKVTKVTIDERRIDYEVVTETDSQSYFTIADVATEAVTELLRSVGVKYTVVNRPADNLLGVLVGAILPPLVAIGAGALLLKYTEGGNGVLGVGKSKARVYGKQ